MSNWIPRLSILRRSSKSTEITLYLLLQYHWYHIYYLELIIDSGFYISWNYSVIFLTHAFGMSYQIYLFHSSSPYHLIEYRCLSSVFQGYISLAHLQPGLFFFPWKFKRASFFSEGLRAVLISSSTEYLLNYLFPVVAFINWVCSFFDSCSDNM